MPSASLACIAVSSRVRARAPGTVEDVEPDHPAGRTRQAVRHGDVAVEPARAILVAGPQEDTAVRSVRVPMQTSR
jgi:hypothetical protein